MYLPIDSKFPGDAYLNLQDAYDTGDRQLIKIATDNLRNAVIKAAKDIRSKYIQTPQGVRLLRSLFSAKLAGGEVSGVMAQQAIAVLVQQEDKHAPLSDQALAERLQVQGIDISRRTVAKYRQLLQIPSAATRRA